MKLRWKQERKKERKKKATTCDQFNRLFATEMNVMFDDRKSEKREMKRVRDWERETVENTRE